jgi:hypothetical protein
MRGPSVISASALYHSVPSFSYALVTFLAAVVRGDGVAAATGLLAAAAAPRSLWRRGAKVSGVIGGGPGIADVGGGGVANGGELKD